MPRRYYSSTAVASTLSASVSNSATTLSITALSGYPVSVPWTAILDQDTASEEVVTVTNVSGTTLTVTRGVDGTSAVSHNAGAVFRHGVSARDFDEANSHVNDTANPHSTTATQVGAVSNSLISASKGALITSTGSAVAALTVGTNGHVLTADSGQTNGIKWAPAASGADIDPLFLAGV